MNLLLALAFLVASTWFFLSLLTQGLADGVRESAWQRLARQFGGRAEYLIWWRTPRIIFRHGESRVVAVRGRHRRSRNCMDVWLDWPDSKLTLHLAAAHRPPPRSAIQGLQPLVSKSSAFHQRFLVYTNDPIRARQLLNDTLRWEIEQLRQLPDMRHIEVRWHRGSLLVRKQISPRDPREVERLIRQSLRIHDQALLTRAEGIQFLAVDRLSSSAPVRCQICGEEIITQMVFCRRCQTPHHRECWEYFGRCATFACQETEYDVLSRRGG